MTTEHEYVSRALVLQRDPTTGCMVWPLVKRYKRVRVAGRKQTLSRLVLENKLGRRLAADEVCRHTCDNPPCVNPEHLIPGTQADNIRDRDERGRRTAPIGVESHFAKLTDVQVIQARELYRGGASIKEIKVFLGLSLDDSTLSLAISGRTWGHVAEPCEMRQPGKPAKGRATEQECIDTIVEAAQALGYLVYHPRPARSERGWRTALQGDKGFFDLVIVGHGRAWFAETKRRPRKPTPEQMLWATEVIRAGLDARLLYVPEEMDDLIAEMKAHYARSRHPSVGSGS